jgi:energy-coupling factor transport system ATP-binding protein
MIEIDGPGETTVSPGEDTGHPLASHVTETNSPQGGDHSGPAVLVDIEDLEYIYEGEANPVLNGVSLTVHEGEFVLILGPSGCGKSTFLNVLNGTIPHTLKGTLKGRATVCGKSVPQTKVATFATEVGMVFQDPEAQIINTRVRDEVCFGLENLCRPAAEILARQAEALAYVGLPDAGDDSIFDMSGGQKQRVSIAAVLAARPRLLALDEPTANLDPAGMAEVFAVLHRLNRDLGTTIVMVEHRVDELADRVSRVVMMDRGRIVFDGSPREAFSRPRIAHSEEAKLITRSAWFPQVSEFALDLATAAHAPFDPAKVPLNVAEAVAFSEPFIQSTTSPLPAPVKPVAAAAETRPLLSIRNLSFAYERQRPILRDISLELDSGSIIALLGQNGSGKTTLAKCLIGINAAPKQTIRLNGKDIGDLSRSELSAQVGYVFQNPDHQFVTDQVDTEIAYGLKVRGFADDAIAKSVDEVLEIVDLARYRHRSPFNLSLGERRRLSVATMLVLEPRLLVLDEPTIGQDHERAQHLMGLMARSRERYGTTVVMITHDVRLVAEWADRAVALAEGTIAFDGSPAELFGQSRLLRETCLLPPPIFDVSTALSAKHPGRVPGALLSVDTLIHSILG